MYCRISLKVIKIIGYMTDISATIGTYTVMKNYCAKIEVATIVLPNIYSSGKATN